MKIPSLHRFKARAEQLVELPLIVRVVSLQRLNRLRQHAFSTPQLAQSTDTNEQLSQG